MTLPLKGARIVIASDGLWDAVNPKTAMHHIRSMPASKAATDLVRTDWMSNKATPRSSLLALHFVPLWGVLESAAQHSSVRIEACLGTGKQSCVKVVSRKSCGP